MTTTTLREKFQAATGTAKKAVKLFANVAEKVLVSLAADFARAVLRQHTGLSLATAGLNLIAADTRRGLSAQNRKDLKTVCASGEKGAVYARKFAAKAGGHAAPARKTALTM